MVCYLSVGSTPEVNIKGLKNELNVNLGKVFCHMQALRLICVQDDLFSLGQSLMKGFSEIESKSNQ